MPDDSPIYEFANLRLSPINSILENTATGKKLKLSQTHCHFLLALLQKSPEIVEYDELREKIWVQFPEMCDPLLHTIHETKASFVKLLKYELFPYDFIKVKNKGGYLITIQVKIISEKHFLPASELVFINPENLYAEAVGAEKSHRLFKSIAALFYGLLFALGLMLEIAYQFDVYGTTAMQIVMPLTLWNSAIMFAALTSVEKFFLENNRSAYGFGAFLLIGGALFSCLAISLFLPFEAVTVARFQTQPAFAAFLKNLLIYFLPLGIFFVFTPFYMVCRELISRHKNLLPNLSGLLFLAVIYSLFSTFYLLDNLLPGKFHGLFVTLVFLRFIVYFGLGAACLLWAKSESANDWTDFISVRRQWQTAAFFGLFGIGLYLAMAANRNYKTPRLDKIEFKTLPDEHRQFFVNVRGAYFEPETVCIRVVGGDCPESAPCSVPNSALKKHSTIAENNLVNVPLTLPNAEFQIFIQNGDSPLSNAVLLHVP